MATQTREPRHEPRAEDMRFRRIETRAVRPDGRVVTGWHSYPRGVGYDVYRRHDEEIVRLYGNEGSTTIGTPMDNEGA